MKDDIYKYKVLVIGAGLSGCEAASASARNGAKTMLISINMDSAAALQFGNYFKWNENKDLFKGLEKNGSRIPEIICKNTIMKIKEKEHCFKKLNGYWIIDRKRFSLDMKSMIEDHKNLETRQGMAVNILNTPEGYVLETTDSLKIMAESVIVCAGTFLNARMVWGDNSLKAGRPGEIQSSRLYKNLCSKGLVFKDKKYLSSPKILKSTINKNSENLKILRNGLVEAYSVSGNVTVEECGIKNSLILIPEGKDTEELYVFGLENDLSEEEQVSRLMNIKGLENVYMTRPGYGIKCASLSTSTLKEDLEVQGSRELFFAGRITGKDTYEDSLAQGFLAGVNAGKKITGKKTLTLKDIAKLFTGNRKH